MRKWKVKCQENVPTAEERLPNEGKHRTVCLADKGTRFVTISPHIVFDIK